MPIYIKRDMSDTSNLPVEILSNINSCKFGKPEYITITSCHNEALKRIQNRYKIDTDRYRMRNKTVFGGSDYYIKMQIPLKIYNLDRLVKTHKEQLLSLIYEEVEDNLDFKAELTIVIQMKAKLYEEHEDEEDEDDDEDDDEEYYQDDFINVSFRCGEVNEHNIDNILNKSVKDMNNDIKNKQSQYDIKGIDSLFFKVFGEESI